MSFKAILKALKSCCICCAKTADIVDKITDIQAAEATLIVEDKGVKRVISIKKPIHIKIKGDINIHNTNTINNNVGFVMGALDESKVPEEDYKVMGAAGTPCNSALDQGSAYALEISCEPYEV